MDERDARAVLLVGFDYLVRVGFARLLAEPHPERAADPVQAFLAASVDRNGTAASRILIAAWRAALDAAADAIQAGHDAAPIRAALQDLIRADGRSPTRGRSRS